MRLVHTVVLQRPPTRAYMTLAQPAVAIPGINPANRNDTCVSRTPDITPSQREKPALILAYPNHAHSSTMGQGKLPVRLLLRATISAALAAVPVWRGPSGARPSLTNTGVRARSDNGQKERSQSCRYPAESRGAATVCTLAAGHHRMPAGSRHWAFTTHLTRKSLFQLNGTTPGTEFARRCYRRLAWPAAVYKAADAGKSGPRLGA